MVMKKSIGRTLAHIDVAANTSVRIHEDFFNSHRDYHYLSENATKDLTSPYLNAGDLNVGNPLRPLLLPPGRGDVRRALQLQGATGSNRTDRTVGAGSRARGVARLWRRRSRMCACGPRQIH